MSRILTRAEAREHLKTVADPMSRPRELDEAWDAILGSIIDAAKLLSVHREEFRGTCAEHLGMSEDEAESCLVDFEREHLA